MIISDMIQLSSGEIFPSGTNLDIHNNSVKLKHESTSKSIGTFKIRSSIQDDIISYNYSFDDRQYYSKQQPIVYPSLSNTPIMHADSIDSLASLQLHNRGQQRWSVLMRWLLFELNSQISKLVKSKAFVNRVALMLAVAEVKLFIACIMPVIRASTSAG